MAFGGRVVVGLVLMVQAVFGQETVRLSLASQEAAEARRKAATTLGYYNLKLGPSAWRFGSGLGVEYNDNVRYTEGKIDDFIIRPGISAQMLLPVSDQNSINLKVSGGYSAYVENTGLSQFFINPGSELSFDIYAGDFWINLHDRFSINQYGYEDPTVAGTGDYARLENAAGLTTIWDLNKAIVRVGYDHQDFVSLSGDSPSIRDGSAEVVFASAGYAPKAEMLVGLESGGSLVTYEESNYALFTEAVQWNAGAFFDARVTEYITVRSGAGYTVFTPDFGPYERFIEDDRLDGIYLRVEMRHRLNQYVDYVLSGGRNISYTFYGGTADLYYARLQATWRILNKISLSTSLDYDGGSQYYGITEEDFDRYGGSISLGRGLTRSLSSSIRYSYYMRDSDEGRDYDVNIVSLNFNYQF